MAKKRKKVSKKTRRAQRAQPAAVAPEAKKRSETAVSVRLAPAPKATTMADLAEEYRYVYADLRRIAVIAMAMFALLVLLNFIVK